ncbi:acyltransferase [Psychrobacter frigidicola]|uniref:Acyltransferase n=1 Tax=Psychrobacter frigidicola TaxID=45611 RepID=A0A5C7A6U6_9GAMM|nr:acyltransferase family protein [Psychrobacter frigidicola]TXD98244.1 acyltransferase [Psychrobacter frigidicola]
MFDKYILSGYRNDIQGLRAIGALIIMIFHIWVHKVSGGVDVFFVISGFLMSSIILKSFFVNGTINPFPFWGGIIKRVAPSAYVVLGTTLIASYLIISPVFIEGVVQEIIASALHIENLQLMRQSVDYLAADVLPSPVQQFWALSIQIQFYIILPLVIIPLAYISKKKKTSLPLFLGIILIIITSFIYAVISVENDQSISYFNPLSRAWEFFFGVFSFLLVSNFKKIKYRGMLGFLGISLIIGGAILIPKGAGFPSYVSLIPVIGAMLIIISGSGGNGLINNILSNKLLVFFGSISFTVYLWHWPILIFYKECFGYNTVGIVQGLVIIFISIILAYFSSQKIESHFKKIPREKVVLNFLIGITFLLPVVASALMYKHQISSTVKNSVIDFESKEIKPFSEDKIHLENKDTEIDQDTFLSINKIIPAPYTIGCNQEGTGVKAKTCSFGDVKSDKKIVLVGSSHATQWLPALDEIGKKINVEIINMTKSGCSLGTFETSDESCEEWNKRALDKIIDINPYAVITNSTKTSANKKEFIPQSYIESWEKIASNGINIIGIRDNPRFNFDVPECIYQNRNSLDINSCSINRVDALLEKDPTIEYKNIISSIDMSDMFCTNDKCLPVFSGKMIYRDSNHMSVEYTYFIRDNLKTKLNRILTDLN